MYKQKISILINSKHDKGRLFSEFETLLSNLSQTGQIQGVYETPFVSENEIISFQTTPERISFSKKYNDEYINLRIKNLEEWCNSKLKTVVIGKSIPNYEGACSCKKYKFLILFTHAFNIESPIECGICGKSIPLYKLKELTHSDRYDIASWESNYKSCDRLQLGCTVGEQWATKQMSSTYSDLSIEGLVICDQIKTQTGIPTYYYLFNYKRITAQQDKLRKCPSCNEKWLLKKRVLNFYDFRCDKCGLLSTFTPIVK